MDTSLAGKIIRLHDLIKSLTQDLEESKEQLRLELGKAGGEVRCELGSVVVEPSGSAFVVSPDADLDTIRELTGGDPVFSALFSSSTHVTTHPNFGEMIERMPDAVQVAVSKVVSQRDLPARVRVVHKVRELEDELAGKSSDRRGQERG